MLISLSHRFIFVANLKTASTSIEQALARDCEVALRQTQFGKHMLLSQIYELFDWVFSIYPRQAYLTFGVIRDPLDYAVSLYQSHKMRHFAGQPHDTSNMTFEEFVESWLPRFPGQWEPQVSRFLDRDGNFDIDFLLDYHNLERDWATLLNILHLPPLRLELHNVSPPGFDASQVPAELAAHLRQSRDIDLLWKNQWAGRLRRAPVPPHA